MKQVGLFYKNYFRRSWLLISDATNEWEIIAKENQPVIKTFIMPALSLCFVFSLLGGILNGKEISAIVIEPFIITITLILSIAVALKISEYSILKIHTYEISKEDNLKLICYGFTATFPIFMLLSLFPNLFFIRVLALYSIYLLTLGASNIIPFSEGKELYLTINSGVIVFGPFLFEFLLKAMLPNIVF